MMDFNENEFDDFSFEDANINEVLDGMGRQLMEMWLDLKHTKERILELEMRYGMHSNEECQLDLF